MSPKTSKKTKSSANNITLKKNPKTPKKGFKMWSAFSILLLIIAVLIFVSWILHWTGVTTSVQQEVNGAKTMVDTPINALGILDIFVAPAKGFLNKVDVIVFIMTLGSFIFIVVHSKALEGFSQSIIMKLKGKEIWAIVPLMLFFSITGTTTGMAEETLGFYPIIIPLMLAAGFDTMTGLLIVLVGAGAGVLTSTVNPFMITIALKGLNDNIDPSITTPISTGDGLVWRLVSWLIFTALAIGFVMWYANRVKKNPNKSVTFATSKGDREFFLTSSNEKIEMNWRRKTSLIIFGIIFLVMIVYLVDWDTLTGTTVMADMANAIHNSFPYFDYTIPGFGYGGLEVISAFFILGAIIVGMVMYIGVKKEPGKTAEDYIIRDFMSGASDIISVCFVIATAAGIGFVLVQSHMQELIVNALASSIGGISSGIGKILILFILFLPLSFLIPSSSGFAAAVFPLLTGVVMTNNSFDPVTASGSVTAFSFASGIINLVTPTSGVVMGAMALSRVDYGKFFKLMLPVLAVSTVLAIVLLSIGGAIGGNIA